MPEALTVSSSVLLREPIDLHSAAARAAIDAVAAVAQGQGEVFEPSASAGQTLQFSLGAASYALESGGAALPSRLFGKALAQGDEEARRLIGMHRAHLHLRHLGDLSTMSDAIRAAGLLHLVAARLGKLGAPLAGFWSSSEQLCSWPRFESLARDTAEALRGEGQASFPTRYWVSVQLTKERDRIGGITQGLTPFTGYELDLAPIPWSMPEVAIRLVGTVAYLFQAGAVLKDGDTLGATDRERFRVGLEQSGRRAVLRLENAEAGGHDV